MIKAETLKIKNISKSQLCMTFINISRTINSSFYQIIKSKTVSREDIIRVRSMIETLIQKLFDTIYFYLSEILSPEVILLLFNIKIYLKNLKSSIKDKQLIINKI